jgi:dipeptidyl aminopeptidase/acylaminoacyl peptidase
MIRAAIRSLPALTFVCALVGSIAPSAAGIPVALDYKADDGWNSVRAVALSDDGRYLAYALTPQDGDPTLVVRNVDSGAERREMRGTAPAFVDNGRFVVFTHTAPVQAIDAARKAGKPQTEYPKNGIGILDLNTSQPADVVDRIKTIAVPRDTGAVIAYLAEPAPSPSPSPGASPSPTPPPNKVKATGATLTIRDLSSGTRSTVDNVTEVVVDNGDHFIAYATQTRSGSGDGVHVYDVAHATTADVTTGTGRFRDLAIARDGSSLAFLSDAESYATNAPHDALYVVDLHAPTLLAVKAVDTSTPGLSSSLTPNADATPIFTRDGRRIFFGTAPAPTPLPSSTPVPMKVDIWSWTDDVLQSQQKHDAEKDRKHTYAAMYDLASDRFVQLESQTLQLVQHNENPRVALGIDDRSYRRAQSWLGEDYADLYAVSLADGQRRLLARKASIASVSPDGRYAIFWDERSAHWIAVRMSDGKRVTLGARAGVRFALEDDDHPEPPQPYGEGGWLSNDRGVLIYDRYDVWLANPETGDATNLTRGAGRRTHTVYSPVQTDPDATAFAADKPILLSLIDERSFASGYASVPANGSAPTTLLRLDELVMGQRSPFAGGLHDLGLPPVAARHGNRYAFSRETFRSGDWWTSDMSFRHLAKATDANPQQTNYRWGTERIISYRGTDGTPLRAVMLVPDNLPRNRKAPMLVYFYEVWTPMFHRYYAPAPGTSPNFTRYVSNGYVVLLPDVRYRIGHPGASALNCILPAVDAAVRSGYVDPKRVGIAGHSWAAYQINYMLTKTHRFRAAEAGAAVDDMIAAYGGIRLESGVVRESQYEHTQSRMGATPWDRPDLYIENSGIFGIRNVTTPYLTIHNDQDGAVPQFEGVEYFTAMRRLGKIAYLFSFDGEDHNLRGREQQKYWTVYLDEWFDYWLKGAPRPSWMNGVDYLHRGERNVDALYGESP